MCAFYTAELNILKVDSCDGSEFDLYQVTKEILLCALVEYSQRASEPDKWRTEYVTARLDQLYAELARRTEAL